MMFASAITMPLNSMPRPRNLKPGRNAPTVALFTFRLTSSLPDVAASRVALLAANQSATQPALMMPTMKEMPTIMNPMTISGSHIVFAMPASMRS